MSVYNKIADFYATDESRKLFQERIIEWRQEPTIKKLDAPTRLDRAKSLGYKAKQGVIIVRVRLNKSKRIRPMIRKGRKSKNRRRKKIVNKNYRNIAEERVANRFLNMEVINSYYVFEDGKYKWFEVILADKHHNSVAKDKTLNWITKPQHTGRAFRGLTSAGKRARGLHKKGKGTEKIRPSLGANKKRAH